MPHDPEERYRALLAEIRDEFHDFRLIRKDRSLLQRSIATLVAIVTLGAQRHYLDRYVTTLGSRIYVTPDWDSLPPGDRCSTLRHERVHLRQFRRWGVVPMSIAYLLLPLPVGLSWCRMRLEAEAYAETLRAIDEERGRAAVADPVLRRNIVGLFTGGAYGWMWPFRRAVERWYDAVVASLPGVTPPILSIRPIRLIRLIRPIRPIRWLSMAAAGLLWQDLVMHERPAPRRSRHG